jgi:hypothetical protein
MGKDSLWLLVFWQLTHKDEFGNIEVRDKKKNLSY